MKALDSTLRSKRERGGAQVLLLLALGLAIVAGGAWNYHRNLRAEQQEQGARPFERYSDAELEQLAGAYEAEIREADGRYQAVRARGVEVRDTALIDEGIREFERVQRSSARVRDLATEVADREARLRDIRSEQAHRAAARDGVSQHLARLLSL